MILRRGRLTIRFLVKLQLVGMSRLVVHQYKAEATAAAPHAATQGWKPVHFYLPSSATLARHVHRDEFVHRLPV
nr:MAG TPA: hypothetical protein [Caudoviricetes sp.]